MPFTLLLSFAKHLLAIFSPTKAQQFIADASSFSLEPNHDPLFLFLPSFSRFSCFSFSIFFFSFSFSPPFPTQGSSRGCFSWPIRARMRDAQGGKRNHRIHLCRPRWFSRVEMKRERGKPVKFAPKILQARQLSRARK